MRQRPPSSVIFNEAMRTFKGIAAKVSWSRSDYPWARLTFPYIDPKTKIEEIITRDSETDVLVVYDSSSGERLGIHIQNKLGNGSFEPYQPEAYPFRAKKWLNNSKYGDYSDFDTILVAPKSFFAHNAERAKLFGSYLSYEDISSYISEFAEAVI